MKLGTLIRSIQRKINNKFLQSRIRNRDFCIISNNCWGGTVYQALGLPYNSPFVGLYIPIPHYMKLLQNFSGLMSESLMFINDSSFRARNATYPIGVLGNEVEIHFLHYKSADEAVEKWKRRKERMPQNSDNYFFKIDDRDWGNYELLEEFHKLPYKNKISFSERPYDLPEHFNLKRKERYILLYSTIGYFDVCQWLNNCELRNSIGNKLLNFLVPYPETV